MSETTKTILVVDDDAKIRQLLRRCFESDGYEVAEAEKQSEVLAALQEQNISLVTLDIQLGAENGLHVAAAIREQSMVPIIMVTGKGDVIDKVVGLEMGADDYISKPFHIREVQARVRSAMRRSEFNAETKSSDACESTKFHFLGWTANPETFELRNPSGDNCELTTTDFRLLMLFLNAPKRILSRDHIMDELNGQDWTPYDRTVDNQVARLRKKIEVDSAQAKIIKTIRGVGYTFTADVTKG